MVSEEIMFICVYFTAMEEAQGQKKKGNREIKTAEKAREKKDRKKRVEKNETKQNKKRR